MCKQKGFTPLEMKISNQGSKRFLTGFTLVELLVVIAIIALMMSILMPALNLAKRQAKSAADKVILHQWSLIWSMYCEDNDDKFCVAGSLEWKRGTWIIALREKWRTRSDILRCPMAPKPSPNRTKDGEGGPFSTYIMGKGGVGDLREECSYAANDWIYNPSAKAISDRHIQKRPIEYHWGTPNVAGGHNIPVFGDAMWRGGGPWYKNDDPSHIAIRPPEFNGQWVPHRYGGEMSHFCIDRHSGTVNHLFMDWSVRNVGLKELWTLKWHREYNTAGHWTKAGGAQARDWPKWMRQFKDY